jgi:hypothetical protein
MVPSAGLAATDMTLTIQFYHVVMVNQQSTLLLCQLEIWLTSRLR